MSCEHCGKSDEDATTKHTGPATAKEYLRKRNIVKAVQFDITRVDDFAEYGKVITLRSGQKQLSLFGDGTLIQHGCWIVREQGAPQIVYANELFCETFEPLRKGRTMPWDCSIHGKYYGSGCAGCEAEEFDGMSDVEFLDKISKDAEDSVTSTTAFSRKIEVIKQRLAAAPPDPVDPQELLRIRRNVDEYFAQFLIDAGVNKGSPQGLDAHRTLWHYMGTAIADARHVGHEQGARLAATSIKNNVLEAIKKGEQP